MRRLGAVLLAGLLLAGCDSGVPGSAASDERQRGPLTARDALGDLRTVDPCGYLGGDAFADHGAVTSRVADLDECTYQVAVESGEEVTVRVGMLDVFTQLPQGTREDRALPRDTAVYGLPRNENGCNRALRLADDVTISVLASATNAADAAQPWMCELADDGVTGVFRAVRDGRITHWEPARDSLATISACETLADEEVATLLGIGTGRVVPSPSGHQCRWGHEGGDTPTAFLRFTTGERADKVDPSAQAEPIADRMTWLEPITGAGVCFATTEHVDSTLADGMEFAELAVTVPPAAGKDPCAIVKQLATSAWPKLPG
jgi:uncharacterized protein DUF3558